MCCVLYARKRAEDPYNWCVYVCVCVPVCVCVCVQASTIIMITRVRIIPQGYQGSCRSAHHSSLRQAQTHRSSRAGQVVTLGLGALVLGALGARACATHLSARCKCVCRWHVCAPCAMPLHAHPWLVMARMHVMAAAVCMCVCVCVCVLCSAPFCQPPILICADRDLINFLATEIDQV